MKPLGKRQVLGPAAAALVLLPLNVASSATPAHAMPGATPTCHGQAATLVGTPDERLAGTDGDDVIVSNGASRVRAGEGDDLICVTGDIGAIWDGPGDDVVDAHRFTGWQPDVALGVGSDRYVGSPGKDSVIVDGRPGDRDRIRTGDGRDYVFVDGDSHWHIDADLGAGNDRFDFGTEITFDLAGGAGRDSLVAGACDCEGVVVRLGVNGTWVDDRQHADIAGFENASIAVGGGTELHGSRKRNKLVTFGCDTSAFGGGGNDELTYVADGMPCPVPTHQYGGSGDDVLRGGWFRDLLYGGRGTDNAVGGDGYDLCRAEKKEECEE